MFKLFVLLCFVHLASAAVYIKSHCPDVKVMENFNLANFGRDLWYEIARYPNEIEKRGDCLTTVITKENDRYSFNTTEILDGRLETVSGYYENSPNVNNAGIIYIHSPNTTADISNFTFPIHILDTDYDNYVITYECVYNQDTQTRHDYAWLGSRSKTLNEQSKNKIESFVKSTGYIDMDKFEWDHFTEESCTPKQ